MGGVDVIQLREKEFSTQEFSERAKYLQKLTQRYQVPLIINDNLEVAIQVNAEGIHVGNHDITPQEIQKVWPKSEKIIGYSIENMEQLRNPHTQIASYLGISPIFSTPTKMDTVIEWGLLGLSRIREQTHKPLVAIGRMNQGNLMDVVKAGANSIAVVSAICGAIDPLQAAKELKKEILKNENI